MIQVPLDEICPTTAEPASSRGGRVIENPLSGERIVVLRTGAETNGEVALFELIVAPGGSVPSSHTHPEQQESFTVLEGRMKFRVGLRSREAFPGDTVVVPPGRPHWFGNAGPLPARMRVEARPALEMAEMFQVAATMARAQRSRRLPNPVNLVLFLSEFEREVGTPFVPRTVARTLAHLCARVFRGLGLDGSYRQLRAGACPPDPLASESRKLA